MSFNTDEDTFAPQEIYKGTGKNKEEKDTLHPMVKALTVRLV